MIGPPEAVVASVARRLSGGASLSCTGRSGADLRYLRQYAFGVAEYVNFFVRLANNAVSADDKRHPRGRTRFSDGHAEQPADGAVGICEQRGDEFELLREAFM
jgi:hypothetical protein